MENKKDLSRDFAIIFGIKPEEVPSNCSDSRDKSNKLRERLLLIENENLTLDQLIFLIETSDSEFKERLKKNLIKARSNELKQYSEMENSKKDQSLNEMKGLVKESSLSPIKQEDYNNVNPKHSSELTGTEWKYENYPPTNNAINKAYLKGEPMVSKKTK